MGGCSFACEVSDGVVFRECVEVSCEDGDVGFSFFDEAFDAVCFFKAGVFLVAAPCEVCAG